MTPRKDLLAIKDKTDVPLEYFQLRSFIAEEIYRLSKNIPDDENLKEFIEELIGTTPPHDTALEIGTADFIHRQFIRNHYSCEAEGSRQGRPNSSESN
jgi:hypothetical protein